MSSEESRDLTRSDSSGNGEEMLPWCPSCEAFAPPTDDQECGLCGTAITYKRGEA